MVLRTLESYVIWIQRFILFHQKKHPKDMGKAEIEAFLSDLARARKAIKLNKEKYSNTAIQQDRHTQSMQPTSTRSLSKNRKSTTKKLNLDIFSPDFMRIIPDTYLHPCRLTVRQEAYLYQLV